MTIRELKAAINATLLPDDAEVFVKDGLNPLARVREEWFALDPGAIMVGCKSEADAFAEADRMRSESKYSSAKAVHALILVPHDEIGEEEVGEELGGEDQD